MFWFRLGWRNIWRNRRRTIIELVSIAGAVFLAVSFSNLAKGMYARMIHEGVKLGSGHVGFYHPDYLEARKTGQVFESEALAERVRGLEDVERAYTRLYVPGLVRSSHGSRPVAAMGIEIERERDVNPLLDPANYAAGEPPAPDQSGRRVVRVAVGRKLATELGVEPGKKIVWMGQDADGRMISRLFRISGLIETGVREYDEVTLLLPREALATMIGRPGAAHELAVILPTIDAIEPMLPKLQDIASHASVRAYTWQEAMPGLAAAIRMDRVGWMVMIAIIYALVGIGTINTLLMSVMERTREFGVIRSLGITPAGVRKMVLAEACVLGGLGVALGEAAAIGATAYLTRIGIDLSGMFADGYELEGVLVEPIMYATWDWPGMLAMGASMLAVAVVASLYPAHRALQVRPAEAMRQY